MASPPFMQLYVADFLADTQHLNTQEIGSYLLILMTMWRAGGTLPHDQKALARTARLTGRSWTNVWDRIGPLFTISGGLITQKRLFREFEKAMHKSVVRAQSGARGGAAKALKDKRPRVAKANRLPQHSSDIRHQTSEKKETSLVPTPKAPANAGKTRQSVPDAFPSPEAKAAAVIYWNNHGRPDLSAAVDDQAAQFRDHHTANGKKMADWAAAWRTWIRNAPSMTRPPRHTLAAVPAVAPVTDTATWVRRLVYFYEGDAEEDIDKGAWSPRFGPKPGQPGCQVPPEAFAAYKARKPPQAGTGGA